MVVRKYPIDTIVSIKEIKDPTPEGELPNYDQIRKDFGYKDAMEPVDFAPKDQVGEGHFETQIR